MYVHDDERFLLIKSMVSLHSDEFDQENDEIDIATSSRSNISSSNMSDLTTRISSISSNEIRRKATLGSSQHSLDSPIADQLVPPTARWALSFLRQSQLSSQTPSSASSSSMPRSMCSVVPIVDDTTSVLSDVSTDSDTAASSPSSSIASPVESSSRQLLILRSAFDFELTNKAFDHDPLLDWSSCFESIHVPESAAAAEMTGQQAKVTRIQVSPVQRASSSSSSFPSAHEPASFCCDGSSISVCLGISDPDEPRSEPCIDRSCWQHARRSMFFALLFIPPLMFMCDEPKSVVSLLIIFVDAVILTLITLRRLSTRIFLYLLRNFEFCFLAVCAINLN